jgi:PAS domain S-box-containing protein
MSSDKAREPAQSAAESHLRDAEARFRSIFESAPIGEAIVAPDGQFLDVNDALCSIIGYTERELRALTFQDITHPDDLHADLEFVRQMLAGEIRTYDMEKRYLHKDGQIVWVLLSVSLVSSTSGAPSYFISQIQDISERKQADTERDRLREALYDAQKLEAIGRLAGGVAHDFNNMLTAIKGYTELLLAELEPGSRLHHEAEQIRRAAEQAASLPEQLLAFARKQPLEAKLVDLNDVVAAASGLLRHLLGERVALITIAAPHAALTKVDPGRVEQMLVNLALNARDAMPAGGSVTITIATGEAAPDREEHGVDQSEPAGTYVIVSVADDGQGMDAETRDRAFEPFFTTKSHDLGSGLGLAGVHGTVSQSGGFVRLESEPGRGTVVTLGFPAAEADPVEDREGGSGVGPVALLAEDENLVRDLVSSVLRREGFEVHAAGDGLDALEQLDHIGRPLDLLVTDLVMPRMGGRELADRVTARHPHVKTVFMSGYSDEPPELAGSVFVSKPFSPAALVAVVDRLVTRAGAPNDREVGIEPSLVTCVIADDHPAVLDSVSRYLEGAGIDVVARVSRSDEALREIEARRPLTALVDITMEPFSGIEVARRAGVSSPQTAIVMYTGHHDHTLLREALAAGARGFVLKETPLSELLTALTTVADGGTYVDALLAGALAAAATATPLVALTKRERQVLTLLSGGMTNEKVSQELGISAETVQSHVRNAMAKLDADTRTQAVATAIRQALIV